MTTVFTIQRRLIDLEKLITLGTVAANSAEYVPERFRDNQLPLFINVPLSARRSKPADTFYLVNRAWRIDLWLRKEEDRLRSQNEYFCYQALDEVYTFFNSRDRLELNGVGVTNLIEFFLEDDSGPQLQSFPASSSDDSLYYMIQFSARVTYRQLCTG
ncbi:MAG: hypothetical protein HC888_05895 [Candidatus Competibacteraceae bacterium]|nr:hypothetical protein [Candidatus Competibacteraceae bacterium]